MDSPLGRKKQGVFLGAVAMSKVFLFFYIPFSYDTFRVKIVQDPIARTRLPVARSNYLFQLLVARLKINMYSDFKIRSLVRRYQKVVENFIPAKWLSCCFRV
ncbi:MAG: hypothetical protein COX19_13885 [Desulfobacterales bacterium CG23_combo_of_CG06-09_8_20_14_all_51_8]|nr:MAG: hypothetical protein COX19_13885 [Desulfobacterales bacterium CG23_combo_of_CG06-09_8_20_14_all_51_8]